MNIQKLTENAISLLKNLIETQSFSQEEENTARLLKDGFLKMKFPFKEQKIIFGQPINILTKANQPYY